MAIYHPLHRASVRITITVVCLLVVGGIVPKNLSGWILKPLFGWGWFSAVHVSPLRASREIAASVVCVTGYVRRAIERTETERAAVEAERDAFSQFADDVRRMNTVSQASFDAPTATLVTAVSDREQLRTIRDRYRETVMAVPGYEEEYGESLRENMAAEFGDELTTAVLEGEQFTPQLQNLLVNQALTAARQREALLEAIGGEYDSLVDARRRLETAEASLEERDEPDPSEKSFEALIEENRRSREHEARYERLLRDRQRQIHRKTRWLRTSDVAFLQEYLYRDFDVRFPVLQETIERVERLRERRRALARAIARRD